jgi:prepilin peptidase CpaA
MMNVAFTQALLGWLALLLLVAAIIDVRTFTISNKLNLAVALSAPLYWWAAGLSLWPEVAAQAGIALLIFILFAAAFYAGMMGGGDVKLAAALCLWLAPAEALRFLIYMSIAGGLLTVAVLMAHKSLRRSGRPKVPYGVAIAIGGLLVLAQRFLNQFA